MSLIKSKHGNHTVKKPTMFAQRFDPNAIVAVEDNEEKKVFKPRPLVPVKRSRVVEEESSEEEEEEQEEEESESSEEESEHEKEDKMEEDTQEDATPQEHSEKFSSVLNRFQQTISLQDHLEPKDKEEEHMEDNTPLHNLEQIPQPQRVLTAEQEQLRQQPLEARIAATNLAKIDAAFNSTTRVVYDNTAKATLDQFQKDIDDKLYQNIEKNFSNETFPIQTTLWNNLLPEINNMLRLSKRNFTRRIGDQLINASTGSGKTLAYSVPLIQSLINRKCNRLRAIILVPTRLLITQVGDTLNKLSSRTKLIISVANLDKSLREEHSKLIKQEPDIFITTPGRLVDHLSQGSISLTNLKWLILDEADRLLNQSFQNWCHELISQLNKDKITINDILPGNVIKMVFSATLTTNTAKLHDLHLYNPKLYMMDSIKLYNLPQGLQEFNVAIGTAKSIYKPLFLFKLLQFLLEKKTSKILLFIKSNEAAIRLNSLLSIIRDSFTTDDAKSLNIDSINSNNTKMINKKILQHFANSTDNSQLLITTDLMSRGIDINNITDVINYDLPISSQQYVHRCGRTARANNSGNVYNIFIGRGENTFWTNHIDIDLSRDVGITVDESMTEPLLEQVAVTDEEKYMNCLTIFKEQQAQPKQTKE